MFCRNCGNEVSDNAIGCMKCGCDPTDGTSYCPNCGVKTAEKQIVCTNCGVYFNPQDMNITFCRNCGNAVQEGAIACMKCGCNPNDGVNYCPCCGAKTTEKQIVCVKCGVSLDPQDQELYETEGCEPTEKKRDTAALLAFFFGGFSIHKFYLDQDEHAGKYRSLYAGFFFAGLICWFFGRSDRAFIFWGCSVLYFFVMWIIAIIEGIIYLSMSDDQFYETYVVQKRNWF